MGDAANQYITRAIVCSLLLYIPLSSTLQTPCFSIVHAILIICIVCVHCTPLKGLMCHECKTIKKSATSVKQPDRFKENISSTSFTRMFVSATRLHAILLLKELCFPITWRRRNALAFPQLILAWKQQLKSKKQSLVLSCLLLFLAMKKIPRCPKKVVTAKCYLTLCGTDRTRPRSAPGSLIKHSNISKYSKNN